MPWHQLGGNINGEAAGNQSGHSVSLSANGRIIAIGAPYNNGAGPNAGNVRVYELNSATWVPRGLAIDGKAAGDNSGYSVSLSADGSVVAIGSLYNTGSYWIAGHVRIYKWNGTAWNQRGSDIDGEAAGDGSGYSISLSANGNVVAIGAPYNDEADVNAGHVRIYDWNGTAWSQRGFDIDGEAEGDWFGHSVSLSENGSVVAIGAINNDGAGGDAGHVRIYEWNGTVWSQLGGNINGEDVGDQSGYSVSLSANGRVVAIGATDNDDSGQSAGHVRVYELNGTVWSQLGGNINGEAAGDRSGFSVSLSANGRVVAIGAPTNSGSGLYHGHVQVYELNGATWVPRGLDIDGEAIKDFSGRVSLSEYGSVVAIGAAGNDESGDNAGNVRVFTYTPPPTATSVCFLADAPVLTPAGYKPISSLSVGDIVRTAAGRNVVVKRTFAKEYEPSAAANPFVIPKGMFGALRALPISPNHEVMTAKGMVKAKNIGLPRMKMTGPFTYYNLELEDWVHDNLVVAGVECESLAPASRITMTKAEFLQFVKTRYGHSAAARLRLHSVCFEESNGIISMPALY